LILLPRGLRLSLVGLLLLSLPLLLRLPVRLLLVEVLLPLAFLLLPTLLAPLEDGRKELLRLPILGDLSERLSEVAQGLFFLLLPVGDGPVRRRSACDEHFRRQACLALRVRTERPDERERRERKHPYENTFSAPLQPGHLPPPKIPARSCSRSAKSPNAAAATGSARIVRCMIWSA